MCSSLLTRRLPISHHTNLPHLFVLNERSGLTAQEDFLASINRNQIEGKQHSLSVAKASPQDV